MTRPRKQTVDWFPHSVNHGRTIFVMERRWGIAGYGFWFKLLEVLGNTEGHFIDAENKSTMDYLRAYTFTNKETCSEMLDQLADLEAIDSELWKDHIIWTDNFVAGLAALYRNRNTPLPVRPDNYRQKSGVGGSTKVRKPRRKEVKEGKEGKEKDIAPPGPADTGGTFFFSCLYFDVSFDYRMKLAREYPVLTDDLLKKEFSNMEDWISDNAGKKKFKANGHLANPKLFIKNWLNRMGGLLGPGSDKPKGFGAVQRFMGKGEEGG